MNLLSWLRPWSRFTPPLMDFHVILYTRHSCHLCDGALALLKDAQKRYSFGLEVVDVDTSPELAIRHGDWVPVVTMEGKVRFKGSVNPILLRRLLRAEVSRRKTRNS